MLAEYTAATSISQDAHAILPTYFEICWRVHVLRENEFAARVLGEFRERDPARALKVLQNVLQNVLQLKSTAKYFLQYFCCLKHVYASPFCRTFLCGGTTSSAKKIETAIFVAELLQNFLQNSSAKVLQKVITLM